MISHSQDRKMVFSFVLTLTAVVTVRSAQLGRVMSCSSAQQEGRMWWIRGVHWAQMTGGGVAYVPGILGSWFSVAPPFLILELGRKKQKQKQKLYSLRVGKKKQKTEILVREKERTLQSPRTSLLVAPLLRRLFSWPGSFGKPQLASKMQQYSEVQRLILRGCWFLLSSVKVLRSYIF